MNKRQISRMVISRELIVVLAMILAYYCVGCINPSPTSSGTEISTQEQSTPILQRSKPELKYETKQTVPSAQRRLGINERAAKKQQNASSKSIHDQKISMRSILTRSNQAELGTRHRLGALRSKQKIVSPSISVVSQPKNISFSTRNVLPRRVLEPLERRAKLCSDEIQNAQFLFKNGDAVKAMAKLDSLLRTYPEEVHGIIVCKADLLVISDRSVEAWSEIQSLKQDTMYPALGARQVLISSFAGAGPSGYEPDCLQFVQSAYDGIPEARNLVPGAETAADRQVLGCLAVLHSVQSTEPISNWAALKMVELAPTNPLVAYEGAGRLAEMGKYREALTLIAVTIKSSSGDLLRIAKTLEYRWNIELNKR